MMNSIGKKNKTEQTKKSQKSKMPKYNLHLLLKTPLTVSLIGENGFDTCFSGHVDVNLMPDNDYKLWVTAFRKNGNHVFDAIILKNVAVLILKHQPKVVMLAKIPSPTHTNFFTGKPIPTAWKLTFKTTSDREKIYS